MAVLRIGKVSSVNPSKATIQVVFGDMDHMVTADLPMLFIQGLKNKFYALPDIGESVACIFFEENNADGFCLGSFYNDQQLPPIDNQEKVFYKFADGTSIEYDRGSHKLKAKVQGDVEIHASGSIHLNGDITLDGNIRLNGAVSCPGYCTCNGNC